MAKKLNQQDLLKLTSIDTPPTDSVAFAAKSDGLYQKVGSAESKLATVSDVQSEIPLVIGTQTANTASWTGVVPFDTLTSGTTIRYWLPRTSASGVTLNLTLKGGGTTGAIACYYGGTTRLTTHYPAGSFIMLTYLEGALINGTAYTGWWAKANYVDGTESYTVRWNAAIKVGAEVTRYKLLVQGSDGRYYPTTIGNTTAGTKTISTVPFLIGAPIIFYSRTTTVAAGGVTSSYNYTGITTSNTTYTWNKVSGWRANEDVYLKGTVSGALFTLDNTTLTSHMTQDLPTSEDGFYYMRLGMFTNTTTGFRLSNQHPIYYFQGGELQSLNTSHGADWDELLNKPSTFAPSAHNHDATHLTSGIVPVARLGTNTGTSALYLRGDNQWVSPPNTTYGLVTTSTNGLMRATDKDKLDNIASNANNYSLPTASDTVLGGIKVGTRLSITNGVLSATQQTANDFTTALKNKLDGIAAGATNLSLGATSTTAYRGDLGAIAYNHSQATANPHGTTFAQINSKPTTLKGYGLTEIETNIRTTTSGLTVLGVDAALNLTGNGGQGSTVFGYKAAESAVDADWFTAIGRNAGQLNVSGHRWSAFGQNAGQNNISGSDWLAFGANAGRYNTTGEKWTAIGGGAGYSNTTGGMWTAIGPEAGYSNTTGQGWLAIGVAAGTSNLASNYWTAIGSQAGYSNTTGAGWTAIGFDAAKENLTGNAWTAIGNNAARSSNGSFFTAIGLQAGVYNSSNEWVAIGFKAAENLPNGTSPALSASNSVHIGSRVKVSANNVTNEIAIGYNVIGKGSNTVVIGNDDITKTYLNGEVFASLTGNATTATTATKLGTATVGSTQLPFYLNAGTATAITQANLRKGLFGTTAIGSTTRPIYIAANGVPTAITGSIANSTTGSAATLTTPRTIAGVSFNGSANIAIPFANLASKPTTLGGYGITDAEAIPKYVYYNPSVDDIGDYTVDLSRGNYFILSNLEYSDSLINYPSDKNFIFHIHLTNSSPYIGFNTTIWEYDEAQSFDSSKEYVIKFETNDYGNTWRASIVWTDANMPVPKTSLSSYKYTNQNIDVNTASVFYYRPNGNVTFTFTKNATNYAQTFRIALYPSVNCTLTFPSDVIWDNDIKLKDVKKSNDYIVEFTNSSSRPTGKVWLARIVHSSENEVKIGNMWTVAENGTELVFKYNGVIKQRMLSDGTILGTGGITALAT